MCRSVTHGFVCALLLLLFSDDTKADAPKTLDQYVKLSASAKITLSQAIEAAVKEAPGARPIEAELEEKDGAPRYEIELLVGDGVKEAKVDARDGRVIKIEVEELDEDDAKELAATRAALDASKTSLVGAIEAALRRVEGGRAIEAELETEDGKAVIEVTVVTAQGLREVEIGAATGEVKKVEPKATPVVVFHFDDPAVGGLPAGWSARETNGGGKPGVWKISADAAAPSKPNVLKLTTEADDATYNVLLAAKTTLTDIDLRVRVRADGGNEDQGGGLIWRGKDENNYYICRFNPLESNYRVYKVIDGKRTQLASVKAETKAGQWYEVRAVMNGERIACYLDGKKLLEATDAAIKEAGWIGLWTKADASSSFDDLMMFPVEGK